MPKHSTTNALITIVDELICTNIEGHHSICSIFFDLRKAFDTWAVPHQKLVGRLESLNLSECFNTSLDV